MIRADRFVLCAGSIQTPAVLVRSGIRRPGQLEAYDHASVAVTFTWPPTLHPPSELHGNRQALVRYVGRWMPGDPGQGRNLGEVVVHVIGPIPSGIDGSTRAGGLALLASAGAARRSIELDEAPDGSVTVGVCRWSPDDGERVALAMRAARFQLFDALATAGLEPSIAGLGPDPGEWADDEPEDILEWMGRNPGPTYHLSSTLAGTKVIDPDRPPGRLNNVSNVSVADASVLPFLPAVGPQLAVMGIAEWVSSQP